jgi:hypothetical protein
MGEQHTPAPWTIIPPIPAEDEEGAFYPASIEGSDGNPVCMFADMSGSGTLFENEADYHLIAAAPDLLEALRELHEKTVIGTDAERHAALHKAWTAIAKVEGK